MFIVKGFDSLPVGTAITNQFQGQGIVFSGGETRDDPSAPSPRNVLKATDIEYRTPEFPVASVSGKFTNPHHAQIGVTVVLSPGAQFGGSATLTAYEINDNEIAWIAIEVPVGQYTKYNEIFSTEKTLRDLRCPAAAIAAL
jgi:hypothetical protein